MKRIVLLLAMSLTFSASAELYLYVDLNNCFSILPPCPNYNTFQSYAEVKSKVLGVTYPANMRVYHAIHENDNYIVEATVTQTVIATEWYSVLFSYPLPGNCHRARVTANDQDAGSAQMCVYGPPALDPEPPVVCHNCDSPTPEPLILDLNGDGIHTTSVATSPVEFDLTGDGIVDRVGWTDPRTEEGILYFDHNRNRVIDGGNELFGDATALPDGRLAKTGFQALAAYDTSANGGNGDGVITAADSVWGKLRVWVDRDHDARMTNDENYALGAVGIVEISLRYVQLSEEQAYGLDDAGNWHALQGAFVLRVHDGQTAVRRVPRRMHDIYFRLAQP